MELCKRLFILLAIGTLAAGFIVWLSYALGASSSASEESSHVVKKTEARRIGARRIREGSRRREGVATGRKRPDFSKVREADEISDSSELRRILDDLQAALDGNDWRAAVRIVQKMQDSAEWPDGIPSSLHNVAIDTLKWFGARAAPELVGYLGSADAEVVESATDAMLEALSDFSLSDRERSALLLGYTKVITDADTLDMMMAEMHDMRPTVRAETALGIYESGNKTAVKVLEDGLPLYFSEADGYEVADREGVERYLEDANRAYAEDPEQAADDEELYGGDKDSD